MKKQTSAALVGMFAVGMFAVGLCASPAAAVLTLTAAGIADNFSLSTFATGFPNSSNIGPLGIAFTTAGGVMVSDNAGNVRIFPTDTDGQTIASAPITASYGNATLRDFAQDGATIYATNYTGPLTQVNQDGTLNRTLVPAFNKPLGLVFNSHTGHLLMAAQGGNVIRDIDPVTATVTTVATVTAPDGIALNADGGTVYAASNGQVLGFNTSTGAQVFSANVATVDGTAIGTGQFAGNLYANCNNGNVYQINLASGTQTLIASGGSRGDFVKVDPHNGTLLLTQTDSIIRLHIMAIVTHPIASLAATAPTLDGPQITNGTGANQGVFSSGLSTLTVTGSGRGSYNAAQVTGINGGAGLGAGYVAVAGFNPATDTEVFALDVLIGGIQATPAQIATLVTDLNGTHSYSYSPLGLTVASAFDPTGGSFQPLSPTTAYNLFLTINGTSAAGYFGFDLTQDPTYPNATVVAIGVVPEPATVGLALTAGAAALSRRPRRAGRR